MDVASGAEILRRLEERPTNEPQQITYVNAHSMNLAQRNPEFRAALSRSAVVLNDGIGIGIAARMRGVRFPENLNGSDFTLRIISLASAHGWRVFLYGSHPGVAEAARTRLIAIEPRLQVAGVCDGYTNRPERVLELIRNCGADLVVVALGQPAQEIWLAQNLNASGCHLGVGVGAFLDFTSGRIKRAPTWMSRAGIEWVFRLTLEPTRLWRRYVIGSPLFLWRAWRLRMSDRLQERPPPGPLAAPARPLRTEEGR